MGMGYGGSRAWAALERTVGRRGGTIVRWGLRLAEQEKARGGGASEPASNHNHVSNDVWWLQVVHSSLLRCPAQVLDDSRALDNKLSAGGGATAGLTPAEAEALVAELKEKLAKLQVGGGPTHCCAVHLATALRGQLACT